MSLGTDRIEELMLPYAPGRLVATVSRRKRRLIGRAIGTVISVGILVAIYFWRRDDITAQGGPYSVFAGIVLGVSVVQLLVVLIGFLRARKELRGVPQGIAVRIGRPGVVVANHFSPWSEVTALEVVPGGLARAERLRLRSADGVGVVPLDQVEVHPATLDSTARAYSGGRRGVDLSRLDN